MIIGDTPAQLGQIKAADAMMIEGKIVTRDDYRALAAQADALRVALSNLHDIAARCDSWEYFPQTALDDASDALSAAPQHHLRQVRADAVEKAVALYTHKFGSDDATNEVGLNIIRRFGEYIHPEGLREYVKQIMAGTDEDTSILAGKGGE